MTRLYMLITVVVLCLISFYNDAWAGKQKVAEPQKAQPQPRVEQQAAFVAAIEKVKREYEAASNELKKSTVRSKRGRLIQNALGGSRTISNWVGTLTGMSTTGDGKAAITVELDGSNLQIETYNNDFSDIGDGTLIPQNSRLYLMVRSFSGWFWGIKAESRVDV